MPRGDNSAAHPALLPPQEAVDDILSALKLDPGMVVLEVRSLKPEAQALITQGLWSHCRALLSQPLDTGASLRDGDARGLLAVGEALIRIDAGQPRGHILQADALTAMGMPGPGVGRWVSAPAPLTLLPCKMEERHPEFSVPWCPFHPRCWSLGPGPDVGPGVPVSRAFVHLCTFACREDR